MKLAETVTFGSSDFNRADHLRATSHDIAAQNNARTIVFWRGKPLINQNDFSLCQLALDHPILDMQTGPQIFLGLDGVDPIFANDISKWADPCLDKDQMSQFLDGSFNHHPDLPSDVGFADLRNVMTELSRRDAELSVTARGMFEWHRSHMFCANCGAASVASQAGWQRRCPDCERSHFPRTDPVVIMLITHGNNVLLGRSPHWPETMYSLLAGFMEPGETIESAVRREVLEEAGVTVGRVNYLTSQPWPFPSSLMIGCMGEALTTDIKIDPIELQDARWISREELTDVMAGVDIGLTPARKGSIAHFLIRNWLKDSLA